MYRTFLRWARKEIPTKEIADLFPSTNVYNVVKLFLREHLHFKSDNLQYNTVVWWVKGMSSFFSAWCTDLENVIKKNHWASFKVVEVQRSFLRLFRPNFWISSRFYFSFRIFVIFSFDEFWLWQPAQPQKGLKESVHFREKDEACIAFVVKNFTKSCNRGVVIFPQKWFFPHYETKYWTCLRTRMRCDTRPFVEAKTHRLF